MEHERKELLAQKRAQLKIKQKRAETDALFEIYVFGKYSDIMSDHDAWEVFSPYLLLLDEDFIHYTYINDNGEVLESRVS